MNISVLARASWPARAVPRDAAQIAELLRLVLAGAALTSLAAFGGAALFRLGYPYPLEVTEGVSLVQVERILQGQPLYVEPTLQHVPLIYGPISFYLSAIAATMLGPHYSALRLVSLLATLGSLSLVAGLIHHETRNRTASLVGAGLLALTFPLSNNAMDLGRVDALFTFFLLGALTVARTRTSPWALAASGLLLGLAGLTKLPVGVAPVALAIVLYLTVTVRWRAVAFVAAALVTLGIGLLLLRAHSGPWPTWFMLDLPNQHAFNNHGDLAGRFWFLDILPRFTFALLLGPVFLLARAVAGDRQPVLFYALAVASLLGLGWVARSNSGGALNVELPAHAGLALLLGLGVAWVLQPGGHPSPTARALQVYLLGLCVVQFALIVYNPRLAVPYRSEQWAADHLAATLASLPGEVFAPNLDAYVDQSARGEQPYLGAVEELMGSYGGDLTDQGQRWRGLLDAAVRERRYSYVVVITEACCEIGQALARNGYVLLGPLFPPDDAYWLWTASRTPNNLLLFASPEARSTRR